MKKVSWLMFVAGVALLFVMLPIYADTTQQVPDQLTLGTSVTELTLTGNGSATDTINVNIRSSSPVSFINGAGESVTCDGGAGSFLFACGSASGSGVLASWSTSTTPAFFFISSPSQTPLVLESLGDGNFIIHQTADLNFSFSSAQGTLAGTISVDGATLSTVSTDLSTIFGNFTATGGSFAGAFSAAGGGITLLFASAADLKTIVGTSNSLTSQVEFPGTITPSVTGPCDFLTGGGWIPNTSATGPGSNPGGGNGKATFAIHGGCKHCSGWGHLNYIDHGTGMHVIGDPDPSCPIAYSVVSNGPTSANGQLTGCRRMRGSANINGKSGFTYDVTACDNREPGTSDTFSITLSNGYSNSGTLGGGTQGGGNIQLHKGNKSFCCTK